MAGEDPPSLGAPRRPGPGLRRGPIIGSRPPLAGIALREVVAEAIRDLGAADQPAALDRIVDALRRRRAQAGDIQPVHATSRTTSSAPVAGAILFYVRGAARHFVDRAARGRTSPPTAPWTLLESDAVAIAERLLGMDESPARTDPPRRPRLRTLQRKGIDMSEAINRSPRFTGLRDRSVTDPKSFPLEKIDPSD